MCPAPAEVDGGLRDEGPDEGARRPPEGDPRPGRAFAGPKVPTREKVATKGVGSETCKERKAFKEMVPPLFKDWSC